MIRQTTLSDGTGVLVSGLCVMHCLLLPLAAGAWPVVGLEFLAREATHRTLVCMLIGAGLLAFMPGYRRHKRLFIPVLGLLGLAVVTCSTLPMVGEDWEIPLTLSGSLILIGAHLSNHHFNNRYQRAQGSEITK